MFLTQSRCQIKLFPPILAYLRADLDYFKTKAQPSFSIFSKKKRTEKKSLSKTWKRQHKKCPITLNSSLNQTLRSFKERGRKIKLSKIAFGIILKTAPEILFCFVFVTLVNAEVACTHDRQDHKKDFFSVEFYLSTTTPRLSLFCEYSPMYNVKSIICLAHQRKRCEILSIQHPWSGGVFGHLVILCNMLSYLLFSNEGAS